LLLGAEIEAGSGGLCDRLDLLFVGPRQPGHNPEVVS
jgi:hypothetical protein